jgi:dTDP-4-amino-4,6-dideoxyglucose formyltransferase
MKRIVVITDNSNLYAKFKEKLTVLALRDVAFDFFCSKGNRHLFTDDIEEIVIKNDFAKFIENCHLLISLHCQQVFPLELIERVRCINIHPGLNPHNRGWYPHIFGIINGKPAGATIHEIDSEIDHGAIIASKQVALTSWDTSETLYKRITEAELQLIEEHLENIISNSYKAKTPLEEGNYNSKNDFKNLCEINMQEQGTFEQFYNKMRALSFTGYNNAWFRDKDGNKIYLNLKVTKEEN